MPLWIEGKDLNEIRAIAPEKIVAFDTETTGVDPETDEIIQISIVDGNGLELLNTYVKPDRATAWPEAQRVNGISPQIVANAPSYSAIKRQVESLIRGADLLAGYNLEFDLKLLRMRGISVRRGTLKFDAMKEFAPVNGVWFAWKRDWKWAKLGECAAHYGITFVPHDSLEDAKATLACMKAMLADTSPGGYLALHGNGVLLSGPDDRDDNLSDFGFAQEPYQADRPKRKAAERRRAKTVFVPAALAVVFAVSGISSGSSSMAVFGFALAVLASFMVFRTR